MPRENNYPDGVSTGTPGATWNEPPEEYDILWQCQGCGFERPLPMEFRVNVIELTCHECKVVTNHRKVMR
jgi:hypothetical protein